MSDNGQLLEFEQEYEEWLATRPPAVAAVGRSLTPWTCYRSTENSGHYTLYSIDENMNGTITVEVDHLEDSFLYGFRVFGIAPETLKRCGCIEEGYGKGGGNNDERTD